MLPSFKTDTERVLWESREREIQVIRAMQRKIARNPIRDFLWRKPWKSPTGPHFKFSRVGFHNLKEWLIKAHDCKDPAVGCSCSGGFRFP